eukprot:jgi/Botrbrau1/4324/Bobra.0232s0016.1
MVEQGDLLNLEERLGAAGKERILLWNSVVKSLSDETGPSDGFKAQLPQLVVATLPLYNDSESQRSVTAALRLALQDEGFVRGFAAAMVRLDPAACSRGECQVFITWTCLLIGALELPSAKKAIAKIAERQAAALTVLLASKQRWAGASRRMQRLLKRNPDLLEEYLEVATSSGSPGLIRTLLEFCVAQPQYMANKRAAFLGLYTEKVLGARDVLPRETLSAYQPLLKDLSEEEFSGSLLSTAIRMMKRSPESVLGSIAYLFKQLQLELDRHIEQLTSDLLPQLRHAREAVRNGAAEVLAAAANRVTDPKALAASEASLQGVLEGSAGGKVKVVTERTGLVAGITALAGAPAIAWKGNAEGPQLASDVAVFLTTYYKEETNEEVKAALLGALGAWLPHVDAIPKQVLPDYRMASRRRTSSESNLRAICSATQGNPSLARPAAELAPGLAKVVADGVAKPAQRADAILALLALAHIAIPSPASVSAQVWDMVSKDDSVIFSPTTLARLMPDEALFAVELVHILLAKHRIQLVSSVPAAARGLVVFYAASICASAACGILRSREGDGVRPRDA